ncbi:MAG: ECF-type sigma factor, partial [Acidobacteriota bacterium]
MGDRADADRGEATRLLSQWRSGDADARERLLAITYDQLRSLARRLMRGERAGHTLQPTGLVNEACLRLLGDDGLPARDRREFLALAALAKLATLGERHARVAELRACGGLSLAETAET